MFLSIEWFESCNIFSCRDTPLSYTKQQNQQGIKLDKATISKRCTNRRTSVGTRVVCDGDHTFADNFGNPLGLADLHRRDERVLDATSIIRIG
jgi:hypothetical protein